MGRQKKPEYKLPDEVLAVLECSPDLSPCKKFRHADIHRFSSHLKEGKCQQCIAWFRQTEKQLETMRLLAQWRKSGSLRAP